VYFSLLKREQPKAKIYKIHYTKTVLKKSSGAVYIKIKVPLLLKNISSKSGEAKKP
jgi:hypothetical protein